MTSNPAFTERNIQKANAYLLDSRPEQKSLVTYHNLQSLYVSVWLFNTLTSTAPIGSSIICMWSPADICEQWERNLSFGSADVRGAGTRDEPPRTSAWEARLRLLHTFYMGWFLGRKCYENCKVTLLYNILVPHYLLDCSYIVILQYNFIISDHSEPVVAHGVMADRLFSAQSVGKISLTCILQIVWFLLPIVASKNTSWIQTKNFQ